MIYKSSSSLDVLSFTINIPINLNIKFFRVLQLCEEFKQGINYQIIQNDMPELKQEQVVNIINKLLANVGEVPANKLLQYFIPKYVWQFSNIENI